MRRGYWLYISAAAAVLLYIILLNFGGRSSEAELIRDKHIAVVLKSHGNPSDFWKVVKAGITDAARESSARVTITGPSHEHMVEEQIRMLHMVISNKPDLIILAANDYDRLRDPVAWAHAQGIPVLMLDSAVNSMIPISFVATDNVEAGFKAGSAMAEIASVRETGYDARILIMSHSRETSSAIERERGVRMALEGFRNLVTLYCDVDYQLAYDLTAEAIEGIRLDGIIGLNEVATLGTADAVNDSGLGGIIPIVGFDNAAREMAYLESGVLYATVVQRPYNMGYSSIRKAESYLAGNKVEPFLNTGSIVITRDNMFRQEYQEVLFPFDPLEYQYMLGTE